MAKGVKKRSDLYWTAFHNRKFDTHVYKRWVAAHRRSKKSLGGGLLVGGDISININNLRRAYHSGKTKPEYRTLLLHSLFEDTDWLKQSYNQFKHPKNKVAKVGLYMRVRNGEPYLALVADSKSAKLTPKMKENISVKRIKAPTETAYVTALATSGRKQQKAAYLLHEAQAALATMIQTITNIIKMTDPLNRFGSPTLDDFDDYLSPDNPDRPLLDGEKDNLLKRYEQIIGDVKDQFSQWSLLFDTLGIDTSALDAKWEQLLTEVSDYNAMEFDRPDVLSNCHETAQEFAKMGYSYFKELSNIDLDDARIDKIPANLKVPSFDTPTVRRSYVKTMSSDNLPEALKDWVSRNSKGIIDLE